MFSCVLICVLGHRLIMYVNDRVRKTGHSIMFACVVTCFGHFVEELFLFVWKEGLFYFRDVQRLSIFAITWSRDKWMEMLCNVVAVVTDSKLQQWNSFAFPAININWWCSKGACPWFLCFPTVYIATSVESVLSNIFGTNTTSITVTAVCLLC